MILCLSLLYLSLLVAFSSGDADEENGCMLAPPVVKKDETIQRKILKDLQSHGFFGKTFTYYEKKTDFTYEFSVCRDVSDKYANVSIVQKDAVEGKKTAIAMRNSVSLAGQFGSWMTMSLATADLAFGDGVCDNISTRSLVTFLCDREYSKGYFHLLYKDSNYCNYIFELRLSDFCGPAPGMSGWSVFFIIVIVCLLVYFISGIIFLRTQRGAKGIDQIPHRHFWFGFGNKLADGCGAICRCDQYCSDPIDHLDSTSPQYSGGYSPIGEGPSSVASNSREKDPPLIKP